MKAETIWTLIVVTFGISAALVIAGIAGLLAYGMMQGW